MPPEENKTINPFQLPRGEVANPYITVDESKQPVIKTSFLDVFAPFEFMSKLAGKIITGKSLEDAPTIFQLAKQNAERIPIIKDIPFAPWIIGFAVEAPLFSGENVGKFLAGISDDLVKTVAKEINPKKILTVLEDAFPKSSGLDNLSLKLSKISSEVDTKNILESALQTKTLITAEGKKVITRITEPFLKEGIQPKLEAAVSASTKEILEQRRGILNREDIARLSQGEIGILDKLAEASPGTVLPAEQLLRAKIELSEKLLQAVTPEEIVKVGKEALPKVLGVRAETGRAFREAGMMLTEDAMANIRKTIEETTDPTVKQGLIEVLNVLSGVKTPKLMDKIVEWATAIKLTSLSPDVKNMLGNTVRIILRFPERIFASGYDFVRATITGTQRERFAVEAVSDFLGVTIGLKEGARQAIRALMDETVSLGERRIEEVGQFAEGAIGGTFGKIVRGVAFRKLTAEDLFFRTAAEQGSRYALATRQAMKEGITGNNLIKRIKEIVENPSSDLLKLSKKEALESIFQENLVGTANTLNAFRNKHPWLKLIVPFFKTPVNIAKYIIQGTPLTFLLPSTLKTLKKGGPEISDLLARMTVGSGIIGALMAYANDGSITGEGPRNKAERDALYRQGWQPYSLQIGDHYISYRGLEPLAAYFGIIANINENKKEPKDETVAKLLFSIAKDFTNQPFLLGLNDFFEAMHDPEKNAPRFFNNFIAGSFVPQGISWIARTIDPTFRRSSNVLQAIEARIPFMSQNVPAIMTAFGEEPQREGGALRRFAPLPITTTVKTNIVEQELNRLDLTIGFPAKKAFGQELNDEEYETLLRTSGQTIFTLLNNIVNTKKYQELSDRDKESLINKVVTQVRTRVKERVFQDKYLMKQIKDRLQKKGYTEEQASALIPEILLKLSPQTKTIQKVQEEQSFNEKLKTIFSSS